MKKRELEAVLKAASAVCGELEFYIIGSQSIHACTRNPPSEVIISQECDLYPRRHPETAGLLASKLGRSSSFARKNGFHVDVVTPEIATLPDGWETRLKPLRVKNVTAWCLEIHDLLVSKLCAGRLKDLELVGALLQLRLGNITTLRPRIQKLSLARDREHARILLKLVLRQVKRA